MKTLELNTWERVQLLHCIPAQRTINKIQKHLRLLADQIHGIRGEVR